MDMKYKVKKELLKDLIDRMKELEVDGLKSKSPKMAKVDIQSNDPELAEELKDKVVEGAEDIKPEMEDEEKQELDSADIEELAECEHNLPKSDDDDEEDLERLMALYRKLK